MKDSHLGRHAFAMTFGGISRILPFLVRVTGSIFDPLARITRGNPPFLWLSAATRRRPNNGNKADEGSGRRAIAARRNRLDPIRQACTATCLSEVWIVFESLRSGRPLSIYVGRSDL